MRARVWRSNDRRGVVISVTATPAEDPRPNQTSMLASLELEGRVKTHGGTVRHRHANLVSFLLVDPIDSTSTSQSLEAGLTTHVAPLPE